MIIHVFNSSVVSGPETLVIPALRRLSGPVQVAFLSETRRGADAQKPLAYARELGLDCFEVTVRSRIDSRAIRELRREFRQRGATIVHAHHIKAATYSWFASLPSRSWKLVTTHHGVGGTGAKLGAYERFYSGFVMKKFDRALTVCSSDRRILIDRGFPAGKIEVHLNGVDRPLVLSGDRPAAQKRIREDWRLHERGIPGDGPILGIVARLDPEKNHRFALDCFGKLQSLAPSLPWRVLCFGSGRLETALREQTRELQLENRVHWMGYRAGLGAEFAGLDLLLSFSTYEGLPINMLEAGWAATPIFSTPLGGVLDLVRPGVDGELLPANCSPESAARQLLHALENLSKLRTIGDSLQERVSTRFTEKVWVSKLEAIYLDVTKNIAD
jgi:glycosyltransferase involved in cell wall biosynthesis